MSHIQSDYLKSGLHKGTSSSTHQRAGYAAGSRIPGHSKDKDRKKDSRTKPGLSGAVNTQKSEYDSMFESKDGKTYRRPKTLVNLEMKELAQKRKAVINEQLAQQKQTLEKHPQDSSISKSNIDTRLKESSRDKSSDSVKDRSNMLGVGMTSDYDASEDENRKKQRAKAKARMAKQREDPDQMVPITLSETKCNLVLHIPSMWVPNDDEEALTRQKLINQKYNALLESKKGSDNYGDHASQVLIMQTKVQSCTTDATLEHQETKEFESQIYPFELDQEMRQHQKTPLELLNLEMKTQIDKEFSDKLKDPNSLLPTDFDSIKMNKDPQYISSREKEKNAGRHVLGTRGMDTINFQKDDRLKGSTRMKTGEFATSKIDGLQGGHTETSHTKSKNVSNINTQILDNKLVEFKKSLENENRHLIMTENENKLIKSQNFIQNAHFIEKIANQTKYHKEYVTYRNYPEIDLKTDKGNALGASFLGGANAKKTMEEKQEEENSSRCLNKLFDFVKEVDRMPGREPRNFFEGRTVSCLDWNPVNSDLLAATYGEFELDAKKDDDQKMSASEVGYLAFWTLKNPRCPERLIKISSKATTCRFSERNPNLIGVGLFDGIIAIYDIRKSGDQPVADSKELDLKHLDAIWDVNWVQKGNTADKGEGLVSISSDGKIIEWSIKKGLESQELKLLNRVTNPHIKNDKADTINFRYTTGFSFNFLPGDNNIYFVSTEDGTIHRCSKSYKEQYLENYFGHSGPVYKVRCNPFWNDVFLSCSADWSCRVWNWREEQAKLVLRSLDLSDEVYDIEWSPYCSTLFASTARDGRLEIWDLEKRSLDPIYVDWNGSPNKQEDKIYAARTCVKFNKRDPVVVSGNTNGEISVYRINGYEDCTPLNKERQALALERTLYPNGFNKGASKDTE